ncbi:hypothetical protein [Streptomyces rhizosphaericus]|uniref:hypothetical protein n=1 Tax=Streptomyces rhizosphaericus TaxID=114699 RepID=UPI0036363D8F
MKKAVSIAGTVAAAALLLSACGSDGGDDKKDTSKDPSSASSAPAEGARTRRSPAPMWRRPVTGPPSCPSAARRPF